ncbi:MAG: hypothetical protein P8H25_04405 [Flavobacteriaceae bacterium]|nr:hypothetical protein [Flavobacteriaceae bacterium]
MELKQVHKVLDRFFEGNATQQEEQVLYDYFSGHKIDDSLLVYRPYFLAITQDRNMQFSGNFVPDKKSKFISFRTFAIAVSTVIAVFIVQQFIKPTPLTQEELVFQEFKANMYLVSAHLNKGKKGVAYMDTFNQTTNRYIKND